MRAARRMRRRRCTADLSNKKAPAEAFGLGDCTVEVQRPSAQITHIIRLLRVAVFALARIGRVAAIGPRVLFTLTAIRAAENDAAHETGR